MFNILKLPSVLQEDKSEILRKTANYRDDRELEQRDDRAWAEEWAPLKTGCNCVNTDNTALLIKANMSVNPIRNIKKTQITNKTVHM